MGSWLMDYEHDIVYNTLEETRTRNEHGRITE